MRSFLLKVFILSFLPTLVFAQSEINTANEDLIITDSPETRKQKQTVRVNSITEQVESSEIFFISRELEDEDIIDTKRITDTEIILSTFSILRESAEKTREMLVEQLQLLVDTGIGAIRESQPQSPFALQRLVDPTRDDTINTIVSEMMDFDNIKNPGNFDDVIVFLDERIEIIKKTLEKKSGVVNIDVSIERINLIALLNTYKTAIVMANKTLGDAELLLAVTESDEDGLSDFFEETILKTSPLKSSTIGGNSTDKEIFIIGKNPKDLDLQENLYYIEDIAEDSISESLKISSITKTPLTTEGLRKIRLEGVGIPGGIVAVFFTPLNLVITTGVDMTGTWSHLVTSDVPEGQYDVTLALLEGGGNVIVASKKYKITVTKEGVTSENISMTNEVSENATPQADIFVSREDISQTLFERFIREYFIFIVSGIALLGLIVSILIIKEGSHRKQRTYYSTMRQDGPYVSTAYGQSLYQSLDDKPARKDSVK